MDTEQLVTLDQYTIAVFDNHIRANTLLPALYNCGENPTINSAL